MVRHNGIITAFLAGAMGSIPEAAERSLAGSGERGIEAGANAETE